MRSSIANQMPGFLASGNGLSQSLVFLPEDRRLGARGTRLYSRVQIYMELTDCAYLSHFYTRKIFLVIFYWNKSDARVLCSLEYKHKLVKYIIFCLVFGQCLLKILLPKLPILTSKVSFFVIQLLFSIKILK
jgi:hypothetical protein